MFVFGLLGGAIRPAAALGLDFWVAAGLVVIALIVAFIVLEPPRPQEAGAEGPDGMTEAELESEVGTTL